MTWKWTLLIVWPSANSFSVVCKGNQTAVWVNWVQIYKHRRALGYLKDFLSVVSHWCYYSNLGLLFSMQTVYLCIFPHRWVRTYICICVCVCVMVNTLNSWYAVSTLLTINIWYDEKVNCTYRESCTLHLFDDQVRSWLALCQGSTEWMSLNYPLKANPFKGSDDNYEAHWLNLLLWFAKKKHLFLTTTRIRALRWLASESVWIYRMGESNVQKQIWDSKLKLCLCSSHVSEHIPVSFGLLACFLYGLRL